MKTIGLFAIIVLLGISCNNREVNIKEDNKAEIEEAMDSINSYVIKRTGSTDFFSDSEGNYYINFESKLAVLRKDNLFLGYLNHDSLQDAVFSYPVSRNNQTLYTTVLILTGTKQGLSIRHEIQRNIKIEKIENKIVYAEQFKQGYDSPHFGCKACIEKIKLELVGDSLVEVK